MKRVAPGDLVVVTRGLQSGTGTQAARVLAVSSTGEMLKLEAWNERARRFRKPRWASRIRVQGELPKGDRRATDIRRAEMARDAAKHDRTPDVADIDREEVNEP